MKVDMSPEAVTERLRLVEELRRLCLSLGRRREIAGDGRHSEAGTEERGGDGEESSTDETG